MTHAPGPPATNSIHDGVKERAATDPSRALNNQLLARLSSKTLQYIYPKLTEVRLDRHHILLRIDQRISSVYFPQSGWVSMVAQLANGRSAEVGLVGSEGLVGLPVLLGSDYSFVEWMVQGPALLWRLDAGAFRQALADDPEMRALLLKYALTFQDQVAQTAACNVSHTLDQRLARWLLLGHDRSGDEFPITQDLLGMLLGVRRAGVTVAAGTMQKAGLIRYSHGRLRVLDRAGLERCACECYAAVQRRCEQVLGPASRPVTADRL